MGPAFTWPCTTSRSVAEATSSDFAQSGHITAVGYELYVKLIEEAVAELKGEAWHETVNPEINVKISAYLPSDYVIDTDVRLSLYRRLSLLQGEARACKDQRGNP